MTGRDVNQGRDVNGSRREPGRDVTGRDKSGSRRERVANSPIAKEAGCVLGGGVVVALLLGLVTPSLPSVRSCSALDAPRASPFPAASPISSTQTPEKMRGARHYHARASRNKMTSSSVRT